MMSIKQRETVSIIVRGAVVHTHLHFQDIAVAEASDMARASQLAGYCHPRSPMVHESQEIQLGNGNPACWAI